MTSRISIAGERMTEKNCRNNPERICERDDCWLREKCCLPSGERMNTLRECPFCFSKDVGGNRDKMDDIPATRIVCYNPECNAEGPWRGNISHTKKDMISAWNRRATPVPPEDARRALEALKLAHSLETLCPWAINHYATIRTLLKQAAGEK
jgi:hypothetical protein